MICTVLRSFPGPGGITLQPGSDVDVSEWLHTDRLIAARFIRQKREKRKVEDTRALAAEEAKKNLAPVPTVGKPAKRQRG